MVKYSESNGLWKQITTRQLKWKQIESWLLRVAHFVVNAALSRKSVLVVDMWKGSRSGVNAGSIHAQKRGISSIVAYATTFPAIITYRHMTRVKASGESSIEQDNSYIERRLVRMLGCKEKSTVKTLIRNIRIETQKPLSSNCLIRKSDCHTKSVAIDRSIDSERSANWHESWRSFCATGRRYGFAVSLYKRRADYISMDPVRRENADWT